MKLSREKFPHLVHFIECDADGSHRVVDIIKVRDLESHGDLLIGSRYLPESKIVGWPMTRRVFSYLLNISIPCLMKVRVSDVTNGLRRYSITAVDAILAKEPINKGFIYLSEQALILRNQGYVLDEVPIIFVDRTLGKSTVTWREIVASLKGISDLFFSRNKLK
jgi:dolichol-phosphate mannosyltransferase